MNRRGFLKLLAGPPGLLLASKVDIKPVEPVKHEIDWNGWHFVGGYSNPYNVRESYAEYVRRLGNNTSRFPRDWEEDSEV